MKANKISNYIISLAQNNPEDHLTNMKLQKILYYLQGFHLVIYNQKLFKEDINAWKYGPVVNEVYQRFKSYGNQSITLPINDDSFDYLEEVKKKFINKVYGYYRPFSPIKLMELTHQESPWLEAFGSCQIINDEQLKKYFKSSELLDKFTIKDKKTERNEAANFLLIDYLYDQDLTDSTRSDTDDIYEY